MVVELVAEPAAAAPKAGQWPDRAGHPEGTEPCVPDRLDCDRDQPPVGHGPLVTGIRVAWNAWSARRGKCQFVARTVSGSSHPAGAARVRTKSWTAWCAQALHPAVGWAAPATSRNVRTREDTQQLASGGGGDQRVEVPLRMSTGIPGGRGSLDDRRREPVRGGPVEAVGAQEVVRPGFRAERCERVGTHPAQSPLVLRLPDRDRVRAVPDEVVVVAVGSDVVTRGVLGRVRGLERVEQQLTSLPE